MLSTNDDGVLEVWVGRTFTFEPDDAAKRALESRLSRFNPRGGSVISRLDASHVEVTDSYAFVTYGRRDVNKSGKTNLTSAIASEFGEWARSHGPVHGPTTDHKVSGVVDSATIAETGDRYDAIGEHLEALATGDTSGGLEGGAYVVLTPERRLTPDELEAIERSTDALVGYRSPVFSVRDIDATPTSLTFYTAPSGVTRRSQPLARDLAREVENIRCSHDALGDLDDPEFWSTWKRGAVADLEAARDRVRDHADELASRRGLEALEASEDVAGGEPA